MKKYLNLRPLLESLNSVKPTINILIACFGITTSTLAGPFETVYNIGRDITSGNTRGVARGIDRTVNEGVTIYEGQQKKQEQKKYEKIKINSEEKRDKISNANNHARDINATTNAFENISNAEERQLEYLIF